MSINIFLFWLLCINKYLLISEIDCINFYTKILGKLYNLIISHLINTFNKRIALKISS